MDKNIKDIETWRNQKDINGAIFEGVKALSNWKSGKQVSEEEFDLAIKNFMIAPADGRREAKG